MRLHRLLLLSALFALPAQAQDETPKSLPSLDAALPAEVRLLLAGTAQGQSLFPVNGSEPFAGTVLKADVISFSANSELVLGATSAPFIVIAARDVKFPDTESSYRIRFETTAAANGTDGADGATGEPGKTGGSFVLPHVYLIADHFSVGNDAKPRMINLALKFRGVAGGDGGRGGSGGDGADGARGRNASSGPFGCKHSGGNGSPGGDGGAGGTGGDGGRGGDGGSVTFVSTPLGIGQSVMRQSRIKAVTVEATGLLVHRDVLERGARAVMVADFVMAGVAEAPAKAPLPHRRALMAREALRARLD
jgi:hypothetical protein